MQEVCDRIGILADGVLVREGAVDELLAIENQTEIIYENGPPELAQQVDQFISARDGRVVSRKKSRATLEDLFLSATREEGPKKKCHGRNPWHL